MDTNTTFEGAFFEQLRGALVTRISTPLYIYIVSAFCIDNWDKILFIAFGKETIEAKTAIVQMEGISIFWPVICGLLFTVLMPFVSRAIEGIHLLSDRIHNFIIFNREKYILDNANKLKLLEAEMAFRQGQEERNKKSELAKIDAESRFDINELEEKHKAAELKLTVISKQLVDYESLRNDFFRDIEYGIAFAETLENALQDSAPWLSKLMIPKKPAEVVDAHNAILRAFRGIEIDKVKTFSTLFAKARSELPQRID